MPRYTGRSSFPLKKELAIGSCIWLTYAAPTVMLYLHPKPKVANICWAILAAVSVLVVLPLVIRAWFIWPLAAERTISPSPE